MRCYHEKMLQNERQILNVWQAGTVYRFGKLRPLKNKYKTGMSDDTDVLTLMA